MLTTSMIMVQRRLSTKVETWPARDTGADWADSSEEVWVSGSMDSSYCSLWAYAA